MANLVRDRLGPTGTVDYTIHRNGVFVGSLYRYYVGTNCKGHRNGWCWLFDSHAQDIKAMWWSTFAQAQTAISDW